jgi:glycosyltransferase involved in cell wall biosynthesis
MSEANQPLVSVIIYNYNYGRYLRQCFDSVLHQQYKNIEILFSDNNSSDDSWEIACEYNHSHPHRFFLAKNRNNFGQTANFKNCFNNVRGKYFLVLGSDDILKLDYIEKAVLLMEQNPDAGLALVHRAILDDANQVHEDAPFYNQTCKIPAPKQAAVYMMATVNPSITQAFYRTQSALTVISLGGGGSRFHGARILDFDIACRHAVIFINEPLLLHRVHGGNDASMATKHLMDVIGAYVLNFDFQEKAETLNLPEVSHRLEASIEKNANLSLRYAVSALKNQNLTLAERYFHLALALHPSVKQNPLYQALHDLFHARGDQSTKLQKILADSNGIKRSVSYDPPEGSIPLTFA